jgi:hypothetical protein
MRDEADDGSAPCAVKPADPVAFWWRTAWLLTLTVAGVTGLVAWAGPVPVLAGVSVALAGVSLPMIGVWLYRVLRRR